MPLPAPTQIDRQSARGPESGQFMADQFDDRLAIDPGDPRIGQQLANSGNQLLAGSILRRDRGLDVRDHDASAAANGGDQTTRFQGAISPSHGVKVDTEIGPELANGGERIADGQLAGSDGLAEGGLDLVSEGNGRAETDRDHETIRWHRGRWAWPSHQINPQYIIQ